MKSILVVCMESEVFRLVHTCFHSACRVDRVQSRESALELLRKHRYEMILIDLMLLRGTVPGNNYKPSLELFWQIVPTVQIVVMTAPETIREAVMAVKSGASNYLTYPIDPDELQYVIESIYESVMMQSELDYLRDRFWESDSLDIVKTQSSVMKNVYEKIRSVAPTKSTVLLIGETGTGKGVIAGLIHRHSNRRNAPYISVHCGAIPDTLIESELFGHEKGAFTGAVRRKLGKFEIAKGGTIFLDEIGTITPSAQIKLLQVLQDGIMQRVGGEENIEANVRVVAATNADLIKMCDEGLFRKDLFYRLNVFPVEIPPLRKRLEDIAFFTELFLKRLNSINTKSIHTVHPHVMDALTRYDWPGNIRELENLLERAYILETTSMLTPESFPRELFGSGPQPVVFSAAAPLSLAEVRRKGIEDIERRYLQQLLTSHKGKINISAKEAEISTRQLHKLMAKYDIHKEDFKP